MAYARAAFRAQGWALMVTPDTLRPEQIHELWRDVGATQAARAFGRTVSASLVDMATYERDLGDGYWPGWREVAAARQRICDVVNAAGRR